MGRWQRQGERERQRQRDRERERERQRQRQRDKERGWGWGSYKGVTSIAKRLVRGCETEGQGGRDREGKTRGPETELRAREGKIGGGTERETDRNRGTWVMGGWQRQGARERQMNRCIKRGTESKRQRQTEGQKDSQREGEKDRHTRTDRLTARKGAERQRQWNRRRD